MDSRDLLEIAERHALVAGVIGWLDLRDPGLADALQRLRAVGRLVGIRHQVLAEPDPAAWLTSAPIGRGLDVLERAGLPFDLMLGPDQVRRAAAVARAHPSLQFVLDHLGKPPIDGGLLQPWANDMRELGREPNVCCKLSGMFTVAGPDWTYQKLTPYLDVALDAFGASRLVFGSDWPLCTQAASYDQVLDVAQTTCAALSPIERAAVLGGNARRVYRLDPAPSSVH